MDKGLDKSIIRKFAKLRVLTNCRYHTMDELVKDLASALEESNIVKVNVKHLKKREKRRSSVKLGLQQLGPSTSNDKPSIQPSDESPSSMEGRKPSACEMDKCAQNSDSEEGSSERKNSSTPHFQKPRRPFVVGSFAESDSVNENFSPVRPHRRKRKFKRMAVDPSVSTDASSSVIPFSAQNLTWRRKNRFCAWPKHNNIGSENMCCVSDSNVDMSPVLSGKRKHSMRERSVELVEGESSSVFRQPNCVLFNCKNTIPQMSSQQTFKNAFEQMEDNMHSLIESSSSLSSSESDAGVYTNDEGREGDDEQSDFYHEAGPACGIPGVKSWWESDRLDMDDDGNSDEMDATFQSILKGSFEHMSWEAKQAYKSHLNDFATPERKIRAGRRRLRDSRPGFSIVSSMNEKISKFLQDPEQNELKLYHMRKTEMDQLSHLASLYSLNVRTEGSKKNKCPVLTKTRNTTQTTSMELSGVNHMKSLGIVGDIKRRRRTPPASPEETIVGENAEPIPETNIGNQLLRNMGWEPGSGLGPDNSGRRSPVTATIRPKYQGFGFDASSMFDLPP